MWCSLTTIIIIITINITAAEAVDRELVSTQRACAGAAGGHDPPTATTKKGSLATTVVRKDPLLQQQQQQHARPAGTRP